MATVTASKGTKNRLLRTESFDLSPWATAGTGSRTADNTANPLNTGTTADLLNDTSAADAFLVRQDFTVPSLDSVETDIFTASVWIKPNTATVTRVSFYHTGGSGPRVDLDITWSDFTLAKSTVNSPIYSAVDLRTKSTELGFHRVSITIRYQTGFGNLRLEIAPAGATIANTGSVWAWGAQIEQGQAMTSYVAVTGATDPLAGTHRTIGAWIAATNGTLAALEVLQLRDEEYEISANALILAATTTSSFYRRIEPASGVNAYDPVTNTGPRIVVRNWPTGATNAGIKVQENFFTLNGIGLFSDFSSRPGGSVTLQALIWIDGADNCRIENSFINAEHGGGDATIIFNGIYIEGTSSSIKALNNNIYNTTIKGASPYSNRGLNVGIFWGNFAETGGAWNCNVFGCGIGMQSLGKTAVGGKSSAFNSPKMHNCAAIECGAGFSGVWKEFSNNFSSDSSAAATNNRENPQDDSQLMQVPDPASKIYQQSSALYLDAASNDFRPRPGSPLIDSGVDQAAQFVSADGPGTTVDILGVSRSGIVWDVGVYEGAAPPLTDDFTIVNKTVGRDRTLDYGTLAQFFEAVPRSLYFNNQKWVAVCYPDATSPDDIGTTIQLDHFDVVTTPSAYIEVKVANRFDLRTQSSGYKLRYDPATTGLTRHRANLWITVRNIKITGLALYQLAGAAETKNCRALELFADRSTIDGLYVNFSGASIRYVNYCVEIEGNQNLVINSIARGSNTIGQGATRGFVITPFSQRNRVEHCDAYRMQGGSTGGGTAGSSAGFFVSTSTLFNRVSGCISMETSTLNGTAALDFGFGAFIDGPRTMDRCISEDATAVGYGSFASQTVSSVLKDAPNGDYRLKIGSPGVNGGANLSEDFGFDFLGKGRINPFDIGAIEGVATPPLMHAVCPKDSRDTRDHHRRATLFDVVRQDGVVHLYSSANEPIVHAGLTYSPSGQISASALRMEASLKEHSLELVGAIVASNIDAAALAAGLYRGARITRRVIDWRFPWTEPLRVDIYRIDRIEFDQEVWRADLVGPTIVLDQQVGELITTSCATKLGTADCGLDMGTLMEVNVQVASVIDPRRQFTAVISTSKPNDYFGVGSVTWIDGLNKGVALDIKTSTGAGTTQTIKLIQKAPFNIAIGDRFDLRPGCRLRYIADCITKYGNGINFQGRPYQPGTDAAFETPTR